MTQTGFIAILNFSTSASDRSAALAQLDQERPGVTAMPGCIAFEVFSGPVRDTGITVLHEWIDQPSFDRYLASDAFARSGEILGPMMTSAPLSRRFRAELVETVA